MLKTTHMQIFSKPVVQACDDFDILMHTSKGKQKKIQVFMYSVYIQASEVKLN